MTVHWNNWNWHPRVRRREQLTLGERSADAAVGGMGSWAFLFIQTIVIALWMVLNTLVWCTHWDPRPWILLNLVFSIQAAYAAPLVLLAGRRSDQKTSERAEYDHLLLTRIAEQLGVVIPQPGEALTPKEPENASPSGMPDVG